MSKIKRLNSKGQMAIFIALIFQILFLFFAMAINMALVVHDKINLQNAADLAAYYAAERQAEILNVIAHTNYQIHQAWKLMNFRYYYLGTLGYGDAPSRSNIQFSDQDIYAVQQPPAACIMYPLWSQSGGTDNPCQKHDYSFPNVSIPIVIPIIPFSFTFASVSQAINKQIVQNCKDYAAYDWWFAANMFVAFGKEQTQRRRIIRALADHLSQPAEALIDITDPAGGSVFEGAKKTFLKNLTAENVQTATFEMKNSLESIDSQKWLPDINTYFSVWYENFHGNPGACSGESDALTKMPDDLSAINQSMTPQLVSQLQQYVLGSSSLTNDERLGLGVEKNPWYLAYISVKATSQPRQIFFPFGQPVQFVATAYAQPFGGTIGPWYSSTWSAGAPMSDGPKLQPGPDRLSAGGLTNSTDYTKLIPMYSRYPGDSTNIESKLWLQSLANLHDRIAGQPFVANLSDYSTSLDFDPGGVNDALAWEDPPNQQSQIRRYEIAAVAPDLFDITYYSIQPNFGRRYLGLLQQNAAKLGIPTGEVVPFGDLGWRAGNLALEFFSVQDQIALANGLATPPVMASLPVNTTPTALHIPSAFWYVREPEHLLTSWVGNDKYADYSFPQNRFGKCATPAANFQSPVALNAPGSCVNEGGRTGYSVKIVSRDLLFAPLQLGGAGVGPAPILNPPPDGF